MSQTNGQQGGEDRRKGSRERGRERALAALEQLLERAQAPGYTGQATLTLDLKEGGVTSARITFTEVV